LLSKKIKLFAVPIFFPSCRGEKQRAFPSHNFFSKVSPKSSNAVPKCCKYLIWLKPLQDNNQAPLLKSQLEENRHREAGLAITFLLKALCTYLYRIVNPSNADGQN